MVQHGQYPNAYYRVSLKAVIRNDKGAVLCVKEGSEFWELPGGGIDHGEDVQTALARELTEEIGYTGTFTYTPIDILTLYDGPNERCMMLVGFDVSLDEPYEISRGDDKNVREVSWIDPLTLSNEDARGTRAIYRFAVDHTHPIDFVRKG